MESKTVYEEEKITGNEIELVEELHTQEQQGQEPAVQEHIVKVEYKNAKENLYDHINISVKALDIFIGVAVTALVVLLLYLFISSKSFQ